MTPSRDPQVEPSCTRASVEAYLRATADQREEIESEIDEARGRAERARRELERLRGSASATVTPIPSPVTADALTDPATDSGAGAGGREAATDTGSASLIDQLRLTIPPEGDRWEHAEVPRAVVNE